MYKVLDLTTGQYLHRVSSGLGPYFTSKEEAQKWIDFICCYDLNTRDSSEFEIIYGL